MTETNSVSGLECRPRYQSLFGHRPSQTV